MKTFFSILFVSLACIITERSFAQVTIIKGKVTDSNSGDPIPFVNVLFKGTSIGTTTDFEGNYSLSTANPKDSLLASYIGYRPKTKIISKGISQVVNFQLEEDIMKLQELIVISGENPAFEILRNVIKNKNSNDKRKLSAYEYDTYTKIELDVDNISEKFRERKLIQKITQVLDSVERIAGEDGKPILPVFITESISKLYYRDNPSLKYENILHSKINGLGVEDGTTVTQMVGSSFQEYNFYQNWLNILDKEFVSPIADGWRIYYDYDLVDSLVIGNDFCYRLDFFPRSPQDLAFTGSIWITKKDFALKQIDATVGKQANINFIEKIKLQQELEPTQAGAWLPVKNRVLIDISELTGNSAGMLAKFYTSNKNIVVNKPHPVSFYERTILLNEDARENQMDEIVWDTLRHEPLTETERNVYKMIDTLSNIPIIKTYTNIVKIIVDGYIPLKKFELGPYPDFFSINNLEGLRIMPGIRSTYAFSKKWTFGAQLGYGFLDQRFKYSLFTRQLISKKNWTTWSIRARSDVGRLGFDDDAIGGNALLQASQRWGILRRGYYFDELKVDFQRELFKGFNQRIVLKHLTFNPEFNFGYFLNPDETATSAIGTSYSTSEVILESRYARDELFLIDDNQRLSMGSLRWPVFTFRYTRGLKGIAGSDFNYNKFRVSVQKNTRLGILGTGNLRVGGEYIVEPLPFTLLGLHLGNQTFVYTSVTYNLMNFGEFVSDRYATVQYSHHFEGLLLNQIPLLRKLKWRLVGSGNLIYGSMSKASQQLITSNPAIDTEFLPPGQLSLRKPYVELGYGIENIFKFFRIDFIHRLSYLNSPDVRRFGVFGSVQVTL